jgi:hypothetical protein
MQSDHDDEPSLFARTLVPLTRWYVRGLVQAKTKGKP